MGRPVVAMASMPVWLGPVAVAGVAVAGVVTWMAAKVLQAGYYEVFG